MAQPIFNPGDLPFNPVSYLYQGSFNARWLLYLLKTTDNELADFTDGSGDMQSAVRLDQDDDAGGIWVTVPDTASKRKINTVVSAYTDPPPPPPPPPSLEEQLADALASIQSNDTLDPAVQAALTSIVEILQAYVAQHGGN